MAGLVLFPDSRRVLASGSSRSALGTVSPLCVSTDPTGDRQQRTGKRRQETCVQVTSQLCDSAFFPMGKNKVVWT